MASSDLRKKFVERFGNLKNSLKSITHSTPSRNTLVAENKELQDQVQLLLKEKSELQDELDAIRQSIAKTEDSVSFYRSNEVSLKNDLAYIRDEYKQLKIQNDIVMNVFQCLYGVKVSGGLGENILLHVDRAVQELEDNGYIVSVDYETRAGCFKFSIGISNTETILIKPAIIKDKKIIAHGVVVYPGGSDSGLANEEKEIAELPDNSTNKSAKKLFE